MKHIKLFEEHSDPKDVFLKFVKDEAGFDYKERDEAEEWINNQIKQGRTVYQAMSGFDDMDYFYSFDEEFTEDELEKYGLGYVDEDDFED